MKNLASALPLPTSQFPFLASLKVPCPKSIFTSIPKELNEQAKVVDLPSNLILEDPNCLEIYKPVHSKAVVDFFGAPVFKLPIVPFASMDGSIEKSVEEPNSNSEFYNLSNDVFGQEIRKDIIHNCLRWQAACRRECTHVTKRLRDKSGSTRKVRPQKGSGRSRAGTRRAPHFRGGIKAHGPVARDFGYKLNRKFVNLGIRIALSAKLLEKNIVLVDTLKLENHNTSTVAPIIENNSWGKVLFIEDPRNWVNSNALELVLAVSNIAGSSVMVPTEVNVEEIVRHDTIVMTKEGVDSLTDHLQNNYRSNMYQAERNT